VNEEWCNVTEAAEMAQVSRQYIHQEVKKKTLSGELISGFLHLRKAQVKEWIAAREARERNSAS
jgi:predicted DNA-binding protein YlxM (UPF0122 family)